MFSCVFLCPGGAATVLVAVCVWVLWLWNHNIVRAGAALKLLFLLVRLQIGAIFSSCLFTGWTLWFFLKGLIFIGYFLNNLSIVEL